VLWGVLHHLEDPEGCVNRLKENYSMLLIREPVRAGMLKGLELGHPMILRDLIKMFDTCLPYHRMYFCDGSVIVLYGCHNYQKKAYIPAIEKGVYALNGLKLYNEPARNRRQITQSL
jgi:hypothetical protein